MKRKTEAVKNNDSADNDADFSFAQNLKKHTMNHKDVGKASAFLHGVFINLKSKVETILEQFYLFSNVWDDDKDNACAQLAAKNPSLSEWQARITKFDEIDREIRKLPKVRR